MQENNEVSQVVEDALISVPKILFKGEINFDTKDNVVLPKPSPSKINVIEMYVVRVDEDDVNAKNIIINPDGSELEVFHKDMVFYDYSKECWTSSSEILTSSSEILNREEPVKTLNTLLVDYNITCRTMNDIEHYLNEEEIPYVVRLERDDNTDTEFHITADDIPVECNFKVDMNIVGSIDHVEKYIIYNK